jgi:hypothetical protein
VDLTFGIGDIVGSIALLISAFTFYISHTQASQSEQIKTGRDLWASINEKFKPIQEIILSRKDDDESTYIDVPATLIYPLVEDIDYFAYLILSGEIKDKVALGFYKEPLSIFIEKILLLYTSPEVQSYMIRDFKYFDRLITKWGITGRDEWGITGRDEE